MYLPLPKYIVDLIRSREQTVYYYDRDLPSGPGSADEPYFALCDGKTCTLREKRQLTLTPDLSMGMCENCPIRGERRG